MADLEQLLRDAGASQEEIDRTVAAFDPARLDVISKATMRQSEFNREFDRIQKEWKTANAQYVQMQNDFTATQAERDAAKDEADAAKAKLTEAEGKIVDTSKFLTQEQLDARQRELAQSQTAYFGDILDIIPEHQDLFGTRIKPKEFLQEAIAAGKPPVDYWEEKYNVKAKREEIAAKRTEEREAAIRRDEREKVLAGKVPGTTLTESKSPFWEPQGDAKQPWDSTEVPEAEARFLSELSTIGR